MIALLFRLIPAVLGMLWVSFVLWEGRAANQALRIQFVCATNVPGMGPQALLKVTNLTPDMIICHCGWLEPGESGTGLYSIPAGRGPWRASVLWQRRDLSRFEVLMNGLRDQLVVACGMLQYHRDPWLPLDRVSYSPEIER
jgi:hypothetical protein